MKHRAIIGAVLIVVSYILGWPAVGVCTVLAVKFNEPLIGIIGGTAFYGFSWLMLLAGIWLMGDEAYRRLKAGGVKGLWNKCKGEKRHG
ncbi:MAG: hypothetical protein WC889_11230 [Myxococcota bacterium]|jgi:hypothetical protein